jgi:hypothetical protein
MRSIYFRALIALSLTIGASSAIAGPYDSAALSGVLWLEQHQDASDGSWGTADGLKPLMTAEAVIAMRAVNRRTRAYFAGVTWLSNHHMSNLDFVSRRILAIPSTERDSSIDWTRIVASQDALGNGGWGLTTIYRGSPLDTALALRALNGTNAGNSSAAIAYLKSSQLTGSLKGWSVGQDTASDPATTAHCVMALVPYKSSDATVPTTINAATLALASQVTSSSPSSLKALAALALLKNDVASPSAAVLLDSLVSSQAADGSWGSDIYITALAAQALALRSGVDSPSNRDVVSMTDSNLRAAVNATLGRNSLDALNKGELASLTSLDASNSGITSLDGLEWAPNLTSIDLRGNPIETARTPTTVILTQVSTYSLARKPIALTARVSGTGTIGKIDFYDRGQLLGTVDPSNGVGVLNIVPPVGYNRFTAQYSGDITNAPSASAELKHLTDNGVALLQTILQLLLD